MVHTLALLKHAEDVRFAQDGRVGSEGELVGVRHLGAQGTTGGTMVRHFSTFELKFLSARNSGPFQTQRV